MLWEEVKMNKSTFTQIKEAIAQWLDTSSTNFLNKNIKIEIEKNTSDCLYIILSFSECLAAIVVAIPDFAPYRFVSFEAFSLVGGVNKMVHSWYDTENTTVEDIIKNLDVAICIAFEYSDKYLEESEKDRNQ